MPFRGLGTNVPAEEKWLGQHVLNNLASESPFCIHQGYSCLSNVFVFWDFILSQGGQAGGAQGPTRARLRREGMVAEVAKLRQVAKPERCTWTRRR